MGVVRREGDWRLEKRGEGVYEITFQNDVQIRVVTADAPPQQMGPSGLSAIPTRKVSTYPEAEGLFEEKAHAGPPLGMISSRNASSTGSGRDGEIDLSELPPSGIGIVLLVTGGFIAYTFWNVENLLVPLLGGGLVLAGLAPFAYAGYLLKTKSWRSAWQFLMTVEDESENEQSSPEESQRTPPTPQKLKDNLFFDRAGQECEWCEDAYDHLEVHHIEPRSEGGPNTPDNLIVLCPNCHEKADREAIPRSKLKSKVERLPEIPME